MIYILRKTILVSFPLVLLATACLGCDFIYRILQKEGAQEKDLVGDIVPFESNERVQEIQKLLKLYGYKVGRADGAMGVNTRNAIEQFQKDHSLKVTRFVDNETWEQLTFFEHYGLVVDGDLNIIAVQMALNEAGYNVGKIDGKMGRKTKAALVAFQKAAGLKPDGRIGFKTLTALSDFLLYQEF